FFQAEDGIRDATVTGVQTCALPICIDVPPAGETVKPLPDLALASRLSYFLWSSTPDAELMALAKAGKLNDEPTLRQQTRRMLQRSEERRVGKEGRCRRVTEHCKKKR